MKPFADRLRKLGTETAFDVLSRARAMESQGAKIIHMEIGEPDFDTPADIRHAAQRALDEGYTHYTAAAGLPALRRAIAEDVARTRGIPVTAENIVVVPGGKMIIFFTIMTLLNPGDEAIYPNPGFPIYESMINFVGGVPVPMRLREERQFSFDPDEFRSLMTPRTKLIILNSPGNPCGGVLTRADLEVVAAEAQEHDCFVLSDEIYSRILYEGENLSIASLPGMQERTVILDGFSKNLGLFQHDCNVIWDLAPHDLSIMNQLLRKDAEAISATGQAHLNGHEDIAFITAYFPDKMIAHVNVNWISPVKIRTTLIGGEKKMLVWNDLEADEKLKVYDKGVDVKSQEGVYNLLVSYRSGDMWAPHVEQVEALHLELSYFADCIRKNEKPFNDGCAGLKVVRILEAASESLSKRGELVYL